MTDGRSGGDSALRLLVANVVDYAIYTLDRDGRVDTWFPGAQHLKGYEAAEIVGQHYSVFFTEEDRRAGRPAQLLATAAREGRARDAGWRVRKDGSRFWADALVTALRDDDGNLCGYGKVTRDLTDARERAVQVSVSEERFRLLVETVQDYAIFMLNPDGVIQSWNTGAQQLKGYSAEEIIGRHFSTFYTPEDRDAGRPQRLLATAAADGRVRDEGWRVRKDGTRFWADVVITALRDPNGELRGFTKVTRDLTDRKLNEDLLREAAEQDRAIADQLRDLDKMKTEFVAMVAHDLRSPLSVVAGFADLLNNSWDKLSDTRKRDLAARISESVKGLGRFVTDVLESAQIETGELRVEPKPVQIGPLVADAAGDSTPLAERDRLAVEVEDGLPLVLADERRTWQIILNLVTNALKFSPPDSRVEVSVRRAGAEVAVSVRDHGPGIAPEDHDKVFERFIKLPANASHSGTGLGLYLSRSLAELQGGRLEVASAPGEGATFTLSLPVAPGDDHG